MVDLEKDNVTVLLEKHFHFLVEGNGFILKKKTNKSFYSGVDYIRDNDELVVSIGYDLRENYLTERIWKMRSKEKWEWQNDENGTSLEIYLEATKNDAKYPLLPPSQELNKSILEKIIKKRSFLFKENLLGLINQLK